ncbi:MAG: leucine-rich repeat protein [Alistipes sp.]|nr:leucine-rich repeat protein [Alistipes sp.]
MKKLLFLLAAVGMIFTACEGGESIEEANGGTPFVPEITISPDELSFPVEGGEQEVAITANFEYKVSEKADWLSVEQTETGLLVKVDKSERVESRYADIVLTNKEYEVEKFISVSQAAFEPSITIKPSAATFSANGGKQEIIITSNVEYEVSKKADWLSVEQTETGLLVTAKESKTTSERSAYISIINEKYSITKTIDIVQEAWVPKIELAQQSIEVEFEPAEYEVVVTSPFSWEATTKNDWIVVESETGIAGEEKLKFTTLRNEEEKVRKGTITLKNTDYNLVAELYVTQKAFVPDEMIIEPESLAFAVEGGTKEVAITANFEYEYSTNADWLTIEKSEKGISVTVPNYVEVDERTAEITISSEKYGISKVVKVTQGAFVPAITIEPETLTFAVEGGTQEVAITANFEYEVSANANWLTIKKSDKGISVTVPNYVEVDERTAEITISNKKYGISKVVNVTQGAFVPEITFSPKSLTFDYKGGTKEVAITANFEEYEYSTNVDWLTIKKSDKEISVTVPNYVEVEERTAEITISNKKYGISKVVKATQGAFIPAITIEPGTLTFASECSMQQVTVTANFEYEYSTNVDWLTIKKSEKGVNITATTNTKFEERTAKITISSNKYNISKVIKATQNGLSEDVYEKLRIIYYTSTDGAVVTPYATDVFGANIVSNTYKDGQGIIIFDAPITSIGDYAFFDCTSLKSVTIPNSVTSIGRSAFWNCTKLTSVTIGNSVTKIGSEAFENCTSLTSVTIGNSVTSIGGYAFYSCSSLNRVTIGNSVTKIGKSAFYDCNRLARVDISDLSAWCNISFGDSAANPLYYAEKLYLNGSELTDITIPSDITEIKDYAFKNYTSLTSVTIGNSVTSIGGSAFYSCTSLTSVTIGNSVTSIGGSAFSNCTSLTSITIPDSVTSIGGGAFSGCTSLTSITIPDSVTSIGSSAFSGCTWLTSVTIGNSVTSIGQNAFKGCTGELTVNCNIPSASKDEYGAFYGSEFTKVTIGNSVTSIGDYAFYDCLLSRVTIGNSVTKIGKSAFYDCGLLTRVDIYGLSAWCKISFGNYYSNPLYYAKKLYLNGRELTDITIPSDITEIKNCAFCKCTSLTRVTIPDSVTSIGSYAFSGCTSLTRVTIPDSVTSIGSSAFSGCTLLKSITIPNSVTSIGGSAFSKCTSLTSITIPDSVTSIGDYAFYYCSSLRYVYCKPTTPPAGGGDGMFNRNAEVRMIYVPLNSVRAYKAADGWSYYASDIVGCDF